MPTNCTASGTIAAGDAVCVTGFDTGAVLSRPIVARATAANLAISKTVFGVARGAPNPSGGVISVNVSGEVAENAITSLGPGTSRVIATDIYKPLEQHQCKLKRIERPDGSEHVVGTCDENGNLAVQPKASRDTSSQHVFNIKSYGAIGDGKSFRDADITSGSTTLTSLSASFTSDDEGKNIQVVGAGVGGAQLVTTISIVTNSTTVTLATAANTSVSNAATVVWRTDNTAAITSAMNAIPSSGGALFFPASTGSYVVTSAITIHATAQVTFEEGAMLAPSASITATIQGRVRCHPNQHVFSGIGSIEFAGDPFERFNVRYWGAVGDAATDDSLAFTNALAAAAAYTAVNGFTVGAIVYVPPGRYRITTPINITAACVLEGAFGGTPFGSSVLLFDKNVGLQDGNGIGGAIFVNGYDGQGTAHGTIIRRLSLAVSGALTPADYLTLTTGIYVAAGRVQIEDVYVGSFQGDGIIFDGDAGALPDGWRLGGHIVIEGAGRYGLITRGEASLGSMTATLDVRKCGSWAVYQSSLYGNAYSGGIHTTHNGVTALTGNWTKGGNSIPAVPPDTIFLDPHIWSSTMEVTELGALILPTVANKTGFQYRAKTTGRTDLSEPRWPTTLGDTVMDGGITWECWMEEGGPVWSKHGPSSWSLIYAEGGQNYPHFDTGQDSIAFAVGGISEKSSVTFANSSRGGVVPFVVQTQRSANGNIQYPLILGIGGAQSAGNQWAKMVDPLIGFWKYSGNGNKPGSYQGGGVNVMRDYWNPTLNRWSREVFDPWADPGYYGFFSYTESDGLDWPQPGAVCWPTLWVGGVLREEKRLTTLPAKTSAPAIGSAFAPDFGSSTASAKGAYQINDLIWNSAAPGTPTVPILWRARARGGVAVSNWLPNIAYEAGILIRPNGPSESQLYRARNYGTSTDPKPAFLDTPGASYTDGTVVWDWWGNADDDSIYEPVIAELPAMVTMDVSAGGTKTLTSDEAAHERIKLTGVLPNSTTVIVEPGAALGWTRTIWNATSGAQTLTVNATAGGLGVIVREGAIAVLFCDGTNVFPISGTSAPPGGTNGDVQFNDGDGFGGDAGLLYDKTKQSFSAGSLSSATGTNAIALGMGASASRCGELAHSSQAPLAEGLHAIDLFAIATLRTVHLTQGNGNELSLDDGKSYSIRVTFLGSNYNTAQASMKEVHELLAHASGGNLVIDADTITFSLPSPAPWTVSISTPAGLTLRLSASVTFINRTQFMARVEWSSLGGV